VSTDHKARRYVVFSTPLLQQQTDMSELTGAFRHFANAPKNYKFYIIMAFDSKALKLKLVTLDYTRV